MAVADAGTIELGGKTVNRLGFGAMRITGPGIWGPPKDTDEALKVLRRAVELGVTLIDTADSYGPYVSEDLIHKALHWQVGGENYGDVVVATKGGLTRHGPDVWPPLGRPEYLRQCILMSLRRLDVDQIDLWQLHRIDAKTPREEQFAEIKSFVDEGLTKQIGLSEVSVEEIKAAQDAGLDIASVQNRYNLVDRAAEDVLDFCEANGIAFIPWAPVASGDLAKPGGALDKVKQDHPGVTTSQLAIAWLLRRSPVMVPIPGTGSVAHLEENLGAADVQLSDEEFEALSNAA
ncbi:Predicted oxidoreductase [Microlunatus sagamiharensis]|uniref:Predicted oxidoreductase n=1 Tax=Microlunatus sagamiharensis TaxID=546874 RepID=A0A1H2M327_9ACTN|nr:aldo/keto reductase [Microlunatus sagamiharensis]SDU87663.1 Predicted oxidoreductase [Microlunatus sagamiharensis]